ncbi:dTMP kinase [Candidatus Kinetoplastidibacterium crithidiae]|uniref:Thymidylate kinase n=1 Tax=Candidatus Kinetoplastidibacterium crithidiae TCC036E TaxID=1208918 RepID=M1LWN3_9PROT|nr:dTMP kinase [Candidatus Kinetoplastibacterium crithidii]AFZ82719.1 thymidylate kinase [Candidatus Kinetoplastibacterium crithidii (ex Angomonas deanei ATCC 30255)]AGF47629.1 dTMP kinase [Candidatus Kinetoplastibacterium crithidii TCC036E]
MIVPGKFITFDGIDGAGKSTQAYWLANFLKSKGIDLVLTREPGGTKLGENIRDLILNTDMFVETETLLLFAARFEHFKKIIEPSLLSGKWVICDRFIDSTYAYQGYGKKLDINLIRDLESWVNFSLQPDITFLFDISFEVMNLRFINNKDLDKFEKKDKLFFDNIRKGYIKRAEIDSKRIKIINAANSINEIQTEIINYINFDRTI